MDKHEEIIKRQLNNVYRLAFARTGNTYDADDITQNVFYKYLKYKPMFNDSEHEKAWFLKVSIQCSNTYLSRQKRKNEVELMEDIPFTNKEDIDLHYELMKLSDKDRTIIHLFYYEQLSTKAIAELLSIREGSVRTRLSRAREKLRDYMKEEDYYEF